MRKGSRTHIPPAFYERNGEFYQPPSFEIPLHEGNFDINEDDDCLLQLGHKKSENQDEFKIRRRYA